MRLRVVLDSLLEVLSVLGVLHQEGDRQRLFQLPLGDEIREEIHLRRREVLDGRKHSEDPLAAPVDARRARSAGDVRNPVAVGNDALRLHELGAVAADDGVDLLLGHELLDELRAAGAVRGVVEKGEFDLHLLAAHVEPAGVVHFLDGVFRGRLEGAPDLGFLARDGQHGSDLDDVLGGGGKGRQERAGEDEEQAGGSVRFHELSSMTGPPLGKRGGGLCDRFRKRALWRGEIRSSRPASGT